MITAQVETLTGGGLDELKPILPVHWAELALNKDKVPLEPNYSIYLRREAAGEVLYITLREDGRLIGYFVGFIAPGLHYQTCLTLIMDIFYVVPEHRGKRGGLRLMAKVLEEAKRRGTQRFFMLKKDHAGDQMDRLLQLLKFEKVETVYSLWMGE